MLYERWRQVVRERRHETALKFCATGEQLTFAQLAAAAEKEAAPAGPVVFPQGRRFILTLLRAWRAGQAACPLEEGQASPAIAAPPAGCVHLKTTSATSGTPRLIAFTAAQLAADAENIVATMGLRPDWPNLGVISLAHSYGFSNLVLPLLLQGIPLLLAESPLPESVARAASGMDAITLAAVPALWRAWHEAAAIPRSVRLAISAGAPLPLALEHAVFNDRGLKLHNFYGSSECGGIAYDASSAPRADAACAGPPLKNVHVSIADDGCLEVRGRAVGETSWPEPCSAVANGCFHSSDLAELAGGLVYLRGRAGDQINIAGRKLSPESVEKILLGHPDVGDCLVFGAPSADTGRTDMVVACVVARRQVGGEVLKQFLLGKLPAWQVPREWLFVKSLEANQRGKLSRLEWRNKFTEGRG
jgi:long-chain acyl-CoA synthetase